jgi:hypothetical protein
MATSYTSDKKIGALDPITGTLSATDEFVVNKNGDTLKTTVAQVEEAMFASKTSGGTPQSGDVVVVRRGSLIRQLETQNLVPDGAITKEKIAAAAGIEDSKLAKITTAGKVGGGAIADGTIGGSTAVNTSGAIATSSTLAAGATTITGNATVSGTLGVTGVLTAAGGVLGNVSTASTLQTARTIAVSGDVTGTTAAFDGSANVSAVTTIANNAVTTAKIADGNVTTAKIADANVTTAKLATVTAQSLLPAGAVMPFARSTAPAGWLIANGNVVPNGSGTVQGVTADFSALYAAVGTSFGAIGTLPNLQGIFVRGSGGPHTINGKAYSGTFAEKQSHLVHDHTHSGTTSTESVGHTHSVSGTTGNDSPDHTHAFSDYYQASSVGYANGLVGSASRLGVHTFSEVGAFTANGTAGASARHQHGFSATTGGVSASHTHNLVSGNPSTDGGTETRPANIALLYCIKF